MQQNDDMDYEANEACVHRCSPVDCPNHVVCRTPRCPRWVLDCFDGLCYHCDLTFGENLNIVELPDVEECFVCFCESNATVEMPAKCGHRVCVGCFREIFFNYATRVRACPLCRR